MKKLNTKLTSFKKWFKTFLFESLTATVTILEAMTLRAYTDNKGSIIFEHAGFQVVLERFPCKSNITQRSNLEGLLAEKGWHVMPDDLIESLRGRYRFNKNFHDIVIITKQDDSLVIMKNNPGKGFRITNPSYEKALDDIKTYLALTRDMRPEGYNGIYFPVSVTPIVISETIAPYRPT